MLAILGVLLHALALVHHHAVMMADALPASVPARDAVRVTAVFPYGNAPICRGNGASRLDDPTAGEPREDSRSPAQRPLPCPVCSGSSAAYAIAPGFVAFLLPVVGEGLTLPPPSERREIGSPLFPQRRLSSRAKQRDNLPAGAAVMLEIRVERQQAAIGKSFRHSNQAGIG